jgi:limonene-1,2-epoxide hydrolase
MDLPVAGLFIVNDGVITLWRDYFDLATFQTQLASVSS